MMAMELADDRTAGMGAGLRDVVDAIWCPEETGVTVSVGERASGSPVVETYFVLPHPARPRILLPADDVPSARAALGAYRGLRTARAELWSRLIRASVLSSLPASRLLRRLDVQAAPDADRLLPHLTGLLGVDVSLRAMLAVRRHSPLSKPTLGLLDPSGRAVAFAKLGRSAGTDAMVRNEAVTLRELAGRLPTIITPRLEAQTTWHGHPVTVMAPLPSAARRLTVEPLEMPEKLWEVAASGDLGDRALSGSSYADRLHRRIDVCAQTHPEIAEPLVRWCRELVDGSARLKFGRSHGDWVSWNLGTQGGRVVVWDWEQSVPDAPIGFDACHWYFQRARAGADFAAAAAAVDAMAPGLVRFGVSADDATRVAALYLLDACVGGVELAAAGGGSDTGDLVRIAELARRRVDR